MHSIEIFSDRHKPFCKTLCHCFMGEYLSDHSIDLTVVHIDLTDEGVDGWCMRESDYEFIIQIEETLQGNEYKKTLLHELYHTYQHLLNIPRCEICANLSEQQNLDRFLKTL